jgi:hypothetical protein
VHPRRVQCRELPFLPRLGSLVPKLALRENILSAEIQSDLECTPYVPLALAPIMEV